MVKNEFAFESSKEKATIDFAMEKVNKLARLKDNFELIPIIINVDVNYLLNIENKSDKKYFKKVIFYFLILSL